MSETETTTPKVAVFVEPTPNPNSLKFILGRPILDSGSYEFATAAEAEKSPLAKDIFAIAGVDGVFLGLNFVSIRKTAEAEWGNIEAPAIEILEEGCKPGRTIVHDDASAEVSKEASTDAERIIQKIIDEEIRPAVAMDGGDIVFQTFEDGILTLKLVGACAGCPSSTMTLRMGIERRLKEDVPELKQVVSLT